MKSETRIFLGWPQREIIQDLSITLTQPGEMGGALTNQRLNMPVNQPCL